METTQEQLKAALDFTEDHVVSYQLVEVDQDGIKASVLLTRGADGTEMTEVRDLVDQLRDHPKRREGTLTTDDLDSFIYLVNRDKKPESVIFSARGSQNEPYIVAVLDFHEAGAKTPHFCKDRVRYGFPLSDEWKLWNGKNGPKGVMSQGVFAQFIEDNIFDVGEPGAAGDIAASFAQKLGVTFASPSSLMTVSRGLEVRSNQRIKESRNLENGDCSLIFETTETDKNGAALNVPTAFHLLIPIFKGGALYSIPVRLRRRVSDGSLAWWFEMHRADLFLNDAIEDALIRVRGEAGEQSEDGTGLPVVMGTPPA